MAGEIDTSEPHPGPTLSSLNWLVQLRWGAIVTQLAAIAVVMFGLGIDMPWPSLLLVVGVEAASNAALASRSTSLEQDAARVAGAILILDVALFTVLLLLTGGSYNPFSFLYLIYVTLASVVLSSGWAWTVAVFSIACFRGLFVLDPLPGDDPHAGHLRSHLEGMWLAFATAAAFIVYFVQRVRQALAQREAELARARDLNARHQKLSSLATLAAGAAHQLATPLSTIAVIAKELENELAQTELRDSVIGDARTIREQVERCREILAHMATEAGQSPGESCRVVKPRDLVGAALSDLDGVERIDIEVDAAADARHLQTPARSVTQALRAVIKNALEASDSSDGRVAIAVHGRTQCCFEITDTGSGMSSEVLAHVGEPFFTTKGPGRGMGLGVFLARELIEHLGGEFTVTSAPGRGTRVAMTIPNEPV